MINANVDRNICLKLPGTYIDRSDRSKQVSPLERCLFVVVAAVDFVVVIVAAAARH